MKKFIPYISPLWMSLFCYFLAVELLILYKNPAELCSGPILLNRLLFASIFFVTILLKKKLPENPANLLSIILIYACLTTLYKETAWLNTMFLPPADAFLMQIDEFIFGFQPAMLFSQVFPQAFISEAFFFGYFSYYLMPLIILGILYKTKTCKVQEFGFLLVNSFLIYYLIFIVLPAYGPQFFWPAPENQITSRGIFGAAIKIIQEHGEARTAAFPSSHVALALIMLSWVFLNLRKYFPFFIPTVLLLILATVYIKAHYAADVLAGFVTAPFVYYLSLKFYKFLCSYVYSNQGG